MSFSINLEFPWNFLQIWDLKEVLRQSFVMVSDDLRTLPGLCILGRPPLHWAIPKKEACNPSEKSSL
jgi:hypothetical protein